MKHKTITVKFVAVLLFRYLFFLEMGHWGEHGVRWGRPFTARFLKWAHLLYIWVIKMSSWGVAGILAGKSWTKKVCIKGEKADRKENEKVVMQNFLTEMAVRFTVTKPSSHLQVWCDQYWLTVFLLSFVFEKTHSFANWISWTYFSKLLP